MILMCFVIYLTSFFLSVVKQNNEYLKTKEIWFIEDISFWFWVYCEFFYKWLLITPFAVNYKKIEIHKLFNKFKKLTFAYN
jgi:hypothetical protein